MPFGPYGSFDECVAKNSDKSSPEGFCAWLHHRITGAWPSEMSENLPEEAWNIYLQAYTAAMNNGKGDRAAAHAAEKMLTDAGWVKTIYGWERYFQAPKMRELVNVPIFAAGVWTDSSGETDKWTTKDLDYMVDAFESGESGRVPLKLGHSSDGFNNKVAQALDVPVEVVTGEHGHGQMAIGWLSALKRDGDAIIGTFTNVPEVIADMIEGKLYHAVSAEIDIEESGPVITGVALLGVEEPAVDIAELDLALVFGKAREHTHRVIFKKEVGMNEKVVAVIGEIKGQFDKLFKLFQTEDKPEFQEGDETMDLEQFVAAIADMLGLEGEGITPEAVIEALKAKLMPEAPPVEESKSDLPEAVKNEFSSMKDKIKELEKANAKYAREKRVNKYTRIVEDLDSITTDADQATKWVDLEEKAGEEVVDGIVKQYQAANEASRIAGITTAKGRTHIGSEDTTDPFEKKVQEYAKSNNLTFQKALVKVSEQDQAGYAEYHARVLAELE